MARRSFTLPDIGEGTAEAELVAWHVAPGDHVEEEQPLCDVMTDKATVEVTSPFSGLLLERHGAPGEMLPVGGVIAVFADGDDAADAEPATAPAGEAPTPPARVDGRAPPAPAPVDARRILASPAVRRRALDLGIDLGLVRGSGPTGRIRHADIDAYLAYAAGPSPSPIPGRPFDGPGPDDEADAIPVTGLRRRIAERMQDAKRRIPHFSYIEEVDASALDALRASLNRDAGDGGARLTILPFLIRAMVQALADHPQLNARFDDGQGIVHRYRPVHVGIATQTPTGLVVTVVRHAERRDLWDTAAEIARLSADARGGRADPASLRGSTITITSLGAMGGLATTPVINSPEVAIVGVNKMVERPIVRDGRIEVGRIMNLSSSFDHRVVDGWDAASFIQRVKGLLETPARLFLP